MSETKKTGATIKFLLYTSIIILAVCLTYAFIVITYLKDSERGIFGDMFGGLTAAFSGLAFAGIIFTILQQKEELTLQREELSLTRKEFELTRNEFKEQNKSFRKQRFENSFFNLLNYHTKIIEILTFDSQVKNLGHDSFRLFYEELLMNTAERTFADFKRRNSIPPNAQLNSIDKLAMERFLLEIVRHSYYDTKSNFYLYFINLKLILKLIDTSSLLDSPQERIFYSEIIRDQMTSYERIILLYQSLMPENDAKVLGGYLKKYHIIDDIKEENLISFQDKNIFLQWGTSLSS